MLQGFWSLILYVCMNRAWHGVTDIVRTPRIVENTLGSHSEVTKYATPASNLRARVMSKPTVLLIFNINYEQYSTAARTFETM